MTAKQKLHQAHLREWAARFSDQKSSERQIIRYTVNYAPPLSGACSIPSITPQPKV